MALWKGSLDLQPDQNYPVFEYTDRVTCQMRWNGTHESCLAWRPARGAVMPGFANLYVDKAIVSKGPGGSGVLIVDMSEDDENTGTGGKPITECVWIEQRIPLSLHPRYASTGAAPITQEQHHMIQAWKDTIDPVAKGAWQYKVLDWNGEPITGTLPSTGGARELAGKYAIGETHYLDCYPVAMLTTFRRTVPKGKPCPRILAEPLFSDCPDGYSWLRTGHRFTRTGRAGKWVIVQQATGSATAWDANIYAAAET